MLLEEGKADLLLLMLFCVCCGCGCDWEEGTGEEEGGAGELALLPRPPLPPPLPPTLAMPTVAASEAVPTPPCALDEKGVGLELGEDPPWPRLLDSGVSSVIRSI